MAGKHRFGALKMVPGVEKVAAFDMFKAQQAAIDTRLFQSTDVDFCRGGTCAAHTMWWLGTSLTSKSGSAYRKESQPNRQMMMAHLAAKITPMYRMYKQSGKSWYYAIKDLASECELIVTDPAEEDVGFGASLWDQVKSILQSGEKYPVGYYISINAKFGEDTFSHGVGVIRTGTGGTRFFDPNAGEYLLQSGAEERLCTAFVSIYRDWKWEFYTTDAAEVGPKNPSPDSLEPVNFEEAMKGLLT